MPSTMTGPSLKSNPRGQRGPSILSDHVITKTSFAGGPVICLSFPSPDFVVYGQGPFLHRCGLRRGESSVSDQLLVFPSPAFVDSDQNEYPNRERRSNPIHGIRYKNDHTFLLSSESGSKGKIETGNDGLAAVFGGRFIAFVNNVLDPTNDMALVKVKDTTMDKYVNLEKADTSETCLTLSDWVWDCRFVSSEQSSDTVSSDACTARTVLTVGMAHNSVQIWDIVQCRRSLSTCDESGVVLNTFSDALTAFRLREIRGGDTSITYSLNLSRNGHVAVGSVIQEIMVWRSLFIPVSSNLGIELNEADSRQLAKDPVVERSFHRLSGHQGVIHSVQFDNAGNRIVSASDDRTIRLWIYDVGEDHWRNAWTSWGHTARCWHAKFCGGPTPANGDRNSRSSIDQEAFVISTGEDGTARLWQGTDGSALAVFRGHGCQSVWRVDTFGSLVVTGGNDGSMAVYRLQENMNTRLEFDNASSALGLKQLSDPSASTISGYVYKVPDNVRFASNGASEEIGGRGSEMKDWPVGKTCIAGLDFCTRASDSHDDNHRCLLVATRSGLLLCLHIDSGRWDQLGSWCPPSVTRETDIQSCDACCLSVDASGTTAAVGTTRGDVVLVSLSSANEKTKESVVNIEVLPTRQYRATKRLRWLGDEVLVLYHVRYVSIWSWRLDSKSNPEAKQKIAETSNHRILKIETQGMPISSAFNAGHDKLIVGDTRGSVALYDMSQDDSKDGCLVPVCVCERAHGKEHVTGIVWLTNEMILSVGNNGCVDQYVVLDGVRLESLLSVSLSPFSGIDEICSFEQNDGSRVTIAGGYAGNIFAIKDIDSGYELFRCDTGGRQRGHAVTLDQGVAPSNDDASVVSFAVAVNNDDGQDEVILFSREVFGLNVCRLEDQKTGSRYGIGLPIHGETVFDACLSLPHCNVMALLTASEDCSSRLSLIRDGRIISSKLLPQQESGARASCISQGMGRSKSLGVVGGGKLALQFFLFGASIDITADPMVEVEFIGKGKPPEKALIDHRINCVDSVCLDTFGENDVHLVVAGDSNGGCYLYRVIESRKRSVVGSLLYRDSRPIICLSLVTVDKRIVLVLGTTAGALKIFELCPIDGSSRLESHPLLEIPAHQVGTNCVCSRVVPGDRPGEGSMLRVCSGGDDQTIFCCDVVLVPSVGGRPHSATLLRSSSTLTNQTALRGIQWVGHNRLVAVSYCQVLSLWQVSLVGLTLVTVEPIEVGDVNCLACQNTEAGCCVAVGGIGVEIALIHKNSSSAR